MLASLPHDARVWLFTLEQPLEEPPRAALLADVQAFADQWASHGRPVPAAVEWAHERVLAVGAYLDGIGTNAGVSGCGTDAMVRAVESAAGARGAAWLSPMHVAYRDQAGALCTVPRPDFRRLARAGDVDAHTPVLDTTAETAGALRAHGVERPAGESWHARAIELATEPSLRDSVRV